MLKLTCDKKAMKKDSHIKWVYLKSFKSMNPINHGSERNCNRRNMAVES
jgi:hypothetical protein